MEASPVIRRALSFYSDAPGIIRPWRRLSKRAHPLKMGEESSDDVPWDRHSPEWRRQSGDWRSRVSTAAIRAKCASQSFGGRIVQEFADV